MAFADQEESLSKVKIVKLFAVSAAGDVPD
jgi:hypothetical protein